MSVTITIDFSSITQIEVSSVQAMLRAYDQAAIKEQIARGEFAEHTEATVKPSAIQEPEAILPAGDINSEAEDAAMDQIPQANAIKGKRGRPRKTEVAAEPVDPQSVSGAESPSKEATPSAESAGDSPEAPTAEVTLKSHTLDELRGALMAFAAKHGEDGIQKGITLLGTFGLARVSEMVDQPVEVQAKFMAACNA